MAVSLLSTDMPTDEVGLVSRLLALCEATREALREEQLNAEVLAVLAGARQEIVVLLGQLSDASKATDAQAAELHELRQVLRQMTDSLWDTCRERQQATLAQLNRRPTRAQQGYASYAGPRIVSQNA